MSFSIWEDDTKEDHSGNRRQYHIKGNSYGSAVLLLTIRLLTVRLLAILLILLRLTVRLLTIRLILLRLIIRLLSILLRRCDRLCVLRLFDRLRVLRLFYRLCILRLFYRLCVLRLFYRLSDLRLLNRLNLLRLNIYAFNTRTANGTELRVRADFVTTLFTNHIFPPIISADKTAVGITDPLS